MAAAFAIVAGGRRLGIGTALTVVASAAGLLFYLGLIFQPRHTLYGLPTPDALARVARAIARAYDASQIDYAPVPVRPGYVILTVAAMWTATTIGELATFRWRRPLIAALPCIGLFFFLSIVGTRAGTTLIVVVFLTALLAFWANESSHRLRTWGRWVAGMGGRGAGEAAEVSGRLARRIGGTSLVAALVAPLFLPSLGEGVLDWRSGVNARGGPGLLGSGPGGQIDLLASLQPTIIEQSGAELMIVRADRPAYWRLESLVFFDGQTWRPLAGAPDIPATGGITAQGAPRIYDVVEQSYKIVGLRGESLPAAVQPAFVEVTQPVDGRDDGATSFEATAGSAEMAGGVVEGLEYEVTSLIPDLTYGELRRASVATAEPLLIDAPALGPEVVRLLETWIADARTPVDQLLAIQDHLREDFTYSTDVEPVASTDYLTTFLLETRAGYCQQFAAAFALLARHLGFPTRVSVGFLPGEQNLAVPDRFVVRGTHAHSWPEVLFDGYGWVAFEPTPRDLAGPPVYTAPPGRGPASAAGFTDAAAREGGGNPIALQGNQNVPAGGGLRGQTELERGRPADRPYPWEETFSTVVTALLVVLLLVICSIPILKSLRTWVSYGRAATPDDLVDAAFRHFEREAADLAFVRRPAESAAAYARKMADAYRVPRQPATRLAGLYERAAYGPASAAATDGNEARALALTLRGQLWLGATWWARLQRLFSPKGLVNR